jgi:glutamine amidotransferase
MKKVTIIDYGMSNLLSISRAIEKVGGEVELTENPSLIEKADYLILPGVGAFYDGMNELNNRNIPEAIHAFLKSGKPFLGICLGMQMMLEEGTEIQTTKGLNIIPGQVLPLPEKNAAGQFNTIPHIGWNSLNIKNNIQNTPFESLTESSMMYFVHSFYATPSNPNHAFASTPFSDVEFCCIVNKDNAWGTQFHPEKSGVEGLSILNNFLKL